MNFHPVSTIFPLLEGEEFAGLVASIKSVGLLNEISGYTQRTAASSMGAIATAPA
jgi:hypothetical protein